MTIEPSSYFELLPSK